MYQVGEATDGAKQMATITAKAMKEIRKSIGYMKDLKKNYLKVEARSKKVLKLEQDCDDLYHEEMANLFKNWARTPLKSSSGRKSSSLSKTSPMIVKI